MRLHLTRGAQIADLPMEQQDPPIGHSAMKCTEGHAISPADLAEVERLRARLAEAKWLLRFPVTDQELPDWREKVLEFLGDVDHHGLTTT